MRSLSFLLLLLAGFSGVWVQAQNTECSGTSTQSSDGTFSVGYNYSFTTNGGNVTAEFQLLDPQTGLVAFAQTYNPNFAEVPMAMIGAPEAQIFSVTFAGQTSGTPFNMACKFAFAGGLSTTAILTYTVGSDCAGSSALNLPIDFESTEINYELQDFGGNISVIVTDPVNANNTVVRSTKTIVAESWAGTTVGDLTGFGSPIPFAPGATSMTVRVWSPASGIPVRLKVEQVGNPTVSVEAEVITTEAMVWETLVFDFSNEVSGTAELNFGSTYNKASMFFNFGTTGFDAGQQIFYWDDVEFVAGATLDLPVNFESSDLNYGLVDFGGNQSLIIVDPTDAGNMVVESIKTTGAATWAGTTLAEGIGFANPIPFAPGATIMTVRVWSPTAGIQIRLKAEALSNPTISVETEATTTLASQWETLTFNFANQAPGTAAINFSSIYSKVSIFFNFGVEGTNLTYYWDDVEFGPSSPPPGQLNLPVTFEDDMLNYGLVDFGGNASEIVVDPTDSGNMVVQSVKTASAELWAGTTVAEGIGFATAIPFAPGSTQMTVRVWSPLAGIPVRLKVEALSDPTISVETEATTTASSQWETLTFNFANQAPGTAAINFASDYRKASIFFNFGTPGAVTGEQTYYWDDVAFDGGINPPGEGLELPVTFEDDELDYGLVDFGGNASEIVVDPTNPANMVVQSVKTAGAELWAGTTVAEGIGFAAAIPFAPGSTQMTVRVWSPLAGIPVRLKAEALNDPTISVETEATTTVSSQWETLTFNFANQASGTAAINFASDYRKASIFFNFGTPGAVTGEQTYYWDDVTFDGGINPPGEGLELPVTFEDDELDYGLVDFGGNASEIVVDPTNPANMVVQSVKTPGAATWAGTTLAEVIGFADAIPFAPGSTSMTVRVWSPTAGIQVRLKAEHLTDPTISVETEATTTMASQWETLTFNFANQAAGTAALNFASSYRKVSIFFNFGVEGTGLTYYWDDVDFGEGTPPQGLELPVTFEEDIDYMLVDFGGNASEVVVDPTNPDNNVARSIKTAGAELWAGTTVGGTVGFTNPIPFVTTETRMNVRVWSPTAGTPVRLKVEASNDATISVETEATTSVAMEWETLEFNFTNQAAGTAALNLANSYNKASIFFNFGTTGAQAGEQTYYWDDLKFGAIVSNVNSLDAASNGILVYPNPASTFINLEFPDVLNESVQVQIFDVTGKMVYAERTQNRVSRIEISNMNNGTYVMRINTANGSYFQKLVLVK